MKALIIGYIKGFVTTVLIIVLAVIMMWAIYVISLYVNCWVEPNCTIGRVS